MTCFEVNDIFVRYSRFSILLLFILSTFSARIFKFFQHSPLIGTMEWMNGSMASWQNTTRLYTSKCSVFTLHHMTNDKNYSVESARMHFLHSIFIIKMYTMHERRAYDTGQFSKKWIEFGWMRQTLCKQEFHFESVKFDFRFSNEIHAVVIRNHVISFFIFDKFRSASREPTTFYAGTTWVPNHSKT